MSVNATAAAALMAGLAQRVRHVVFSPGSRSTPLVLAADAQLNAVPVLDERVAGFVALGLAKATGAPVALVCTSGSAGAHWLPAVIEAWRSRVPLILLTADRPPALYGCGAGQTIDQRRLFGAFVTASRDLPVPDAAVDPRVFAHAGAEVGVRAVAAGRPQHLNVPMSEPLWTPDEVAAPTSPPRHLLPGRPTLDARAMDALADRLRTARRGVIYCGPRAQVLPAQIDALSSALGWPAFCEAVSGARFGPGAPATRVWAYEALAEHFEAPDCVLQFGQAPHSRAINGWLADAPILAVDAHGDRHDPRHAMEALVHADPGRVAQALTRRARTAEGAWRDRWIAAQAAFDQQVSAALAADAWEGRLAHLAAARTRGALCVSSSMPFRDVDAFAAAGPDPRPVYASRGANGIDGIVATATGVALTRPTTLVVGDLALIHDAGGLLNAGESARRSPALNLTIVVPDNQGGGIFERLPIAAHPTAFERCFLTPQSADFAGLAQAAGARYQRLDDAAEWGSAIAAAHARPGVDLLHAPIDRAFSVARRAEALRVGGAP